MRRTRLAACVGVVGAIWASTARPADKAVDAAAAKKGRVTYVRYCVACHGPDAKGDGPLSKDLTIPVPDLQLLSARNNSAYPFDRVVRTIESGEAVRGHGTVDMPAWGDAFRRTDGTGERNPKAAIRNLTHYLWSIQRPST